MEASPTTAAWCLVLLDDLEEFTTLAWFLVADGKLVEEVFSRTMTELERIPFDAPAPFQAREKVRKLRITQALAVLESTSRKDHEERVTPPSGLGELPDPARLAFMLRMVIRSSLAEVAGLLDVTPCEARKLVSHAIDHLCGKNPQPLLSGR
jgi:DNA-directed RNA polymerase specialized sigma24 family protein